MAIEQLFESIDMLGAPYEAFLFDTDLSQLPMSPHWHYFMEILYIVEGNILIDCDYGSYYLKVGDMILFYPRMVHSIYAATPGHIQYYVLKFDISRLEFESSSVLKMSTLFDISRRDSDIPIVLTSENIKKIPFANYFTICIEELRNNYFGSDLLVHSAICNLLVDVIRHWINQGYDINQNTTAENDIHSIYTILEYIDAHASESLRVENLASICNISYSFFAKKFKELYGRPCKEYIEFIRVCKAEALLLFSSGDLNYISQETGFSDSSHLIKTFKKWKGITPRQYSLNHCKKEIPK